MTKEHKLLTAPKTLYYILNHEMCDFSPYSGNCAPRRRGALECLRVFLYFSILSEMSDGVMILL